LDPTTKKDLSQFVIRDKPPVKSATGQTQDLLSAQSEMSGFPPVQKKDLSQFVIRKEPVQTAPANLRVEDVINDPERLGKIRTMMTKTKDVSYEQATAEEVMKDFMSHMRFLNTNELSVGAELLNVTIADESTRAIYGDAYKVYEEMGSVFSNGDFWGGSLDYAQAIVTSPSTYLGMGLGRIIGQTGTKAASKKVLAKAIEATATQAAKKSAGRISKETIKNQLKTEAAKVTARNAIIGTVAVEGGTGLLADSMYQDVMMKTGVQEEFSVAQAAISTLASSLAAIGPAYMLIKNSDSTLAKTGDLITQAKKARSKKAAQTALPEIKSSFEKANIEWEKLTKQGMEFKDNYALQKSVASWFFDPKRDDSFIRILQKAGVQLDTASEGNFARSIAEYGAGLSDEVLEEYNKVFQPLGIKFGEALSIMANVASEAGKDFNLMSQASKFMNDFQNVTVSRQNAEKVIADSIKELADEAAKVSDKQIVGYALSTWKKTLVSTFGTTAVNVKGWGLTRLANSAADMAMAGGLLGRAGVRALVDPAGAIKDYTKMKHIMQNQVFTYKTLLDPFVSAEGFMKLLENAPKKSQRNVAGTIFGGVDDFSAARFGLNPDKGVVKGVEKLTDAAQAISLVRMQDILTKGMSGIARLDKESRRAFGKGIEDLIRDGETYKLTEEMWTNVTRQVLEETFSEDLTKGGGLFAGLASAIERVSNNPVGGFVIPFGRFMNNTMAFVYRFSPLGLITPAMRAFKGADTGERIAKAAVGTVALVYLADQEEEKQAQGLQWFERKTDTGSVENISTLFPYSLYALLGRVGMGVRNGEGLNYQLLEEIKKNLGPLDALEGIAAPTALDDILRYLSDPAVEDSERNEFFEVFKVAAKTLGGVASGYTRPLEIYSRTASYMNPEAGGGLAIDRKQEVEGVDPIVLELTRNVSGFINYLFGEENEYGVRMYGRPKESASLEGPARLANPAGTVSGNTYQPAVRNINKILGLVDKPPFRADSFTSGVPEYDAYIKKNITPALESAAESLLTNKVFQGLPKSRQIEEVDKMLKRVEDELLAMIEGGYLGDQNIMLINERRKLLTRDRQARIRAKNALKITTKDHRLTFYQIEAIKTYLDLEAEESKQIQQ